MDSCAVPWIKQNIPVNYTYSDDIALLGAASGLGAGNFLVLHAAEDPLAVPVTAGPIEAHEADKLGLEPNTIGCLQGVCRPDQKTTNEWFSLALIPYDDWNSVKFGNQLTKHLRDAAFAALQAGLEVLATMDLLGLTSKDIKSTLWPYDLWPLALGFLTCITRPNVKSPAISTITRHMLNPTFTVISNSFFDNSVSFHATIEWLTAIWSQNS